jgi:hypothetical protein
MLIMMGVFPRSSGVSVVPCLRLFGKLFIILLVIVLHIMKLVMHVFLLLGQRFRVLLHCRANRKLIFLLSDDNLVCLDVSIYRILYTLFLQRAKLVEPTGPGKETLVS